MNDKVNSSEGMLDIANIKQEMIVHEMHHPKTEEEIGIRVHLLPTTDEKIKKLSRQIQDRRNYLAQRNKTIKTEELEEFRLDMMTVAIANWEWYGQVSFHGRKPDCTPKEIRAVCKELEWFINEIDEKLAISKDFFID